MTISRWLLGSMAGSILAAGCASPKIVTNITSRPGQMKFLYQQSRDQGLVQCKTTADGNVEQCSNKPIVFKDEE